MPGGAEEGVWGAMLLLAPPNFSFGSLLLLLLLPLFLLLLLLLLFLNPSHYSSLKETMSPPIVMFFEVVHLFDLSMRSHFDK